MIIYFVNIKREHNIHLEDENLVMLSLDGNLDMFSLWYLSYQVKIWTMTTLKKGHGYVFDSWEY